LTLIENVPLAVVVVPPVCPLMLIETLDKGMLLSDVTVPLTVRFSWANEKREALKKRRCRSKSFPLCKNANCFFSMAVVFYNLESREEGLPLVGVGIYFRSKGKN
jgi:hypothetical protein